MTYQIGYDEEASEQFLALDKPIQIRISKKIAQLERDDFSSRHSKQGADWFVEEVGGYRIAFKILEKEKIKRIVFVGDHKQYQKWYSRK